jgi:hypothetical protein
VFRRKYFSSSLKIRLNEEFKKNTIPTNSTFNFKKYLLEGTYFIDKRFVLSKSRPTATVVLITTVLYCFLK